MSLYFYYYCFKCICLYVFSGLDITYQGVTVKGNTLVIKDIIALGSLSSNLGKVVLSYFSFDFHMCPYICVWRDGWANSIHSVLVSAVSWSNSIHSVLVSAVSCQSMALSSTLYVLSDPFKFCFLKTRHHYFVWTSWQPVDNKTVPKFVVDVVHMTALMLYVLGQNIFTHVGQGSEKLWIFLKTQPGGIFGFYLVLGFSRVFFI